MKRSVFFTDTPRTALGSVDANQYFALLRNGVDLPVGKFGVLAQLSLFAVPERATSLIFKDFDLKGLHYGA
jgi:hypothetical protein